MSIYEQMRANRAQQAQDRRAEQAQRAADRRADRATAREQDRADRQAQQTQREQHRAHRRARCAAGLRWVAGHPVELLMAAIIVVPALLAWTAMAAYGHQIYGPIGVLLPLFTEAAMWGFAFKQHQARRAGSPTGWLQVGTGAFTAVAAVLNFVHGHAAGGASVGLVMAVVSVGGVVAHQIITAAPLRARRTRADRRQARTERLATRRVTRMERAALRQAVGELDADGSVRLLHEPGTVTLRRSLTGRARLDHTDVAAPHADGSTVADSVAEVIGTEVEQWLSTRPDPAGESASTEQPSALDSVPRQSTGDLQESTPERAAIPEPARRSIDVLRAELSAAIETEGVEVDPSSAESIRRALRCGAKAARQLRDEWNDGTAGTPA